MTRIFGRLNGKAFDMLPWQMHHVAPRRHQICPYPHTCTALMLAHCLLHRRRQSRRRKSPLRAHTCSLHACSMPARVHRANMPCICMYLSCPYLCAVSVCTRLPRFLCLYIFESSASCVRSVRWMYPGATTHLVSSFTGHDHWGGGSSPSKMGSRRRPLYCHAAWPTLVHFVLAVTLSMPRRDLTSILPPTQHPCNHPPPHPHTLHTAFQ